MAIASLVLGIITLVFVVIPPLWLIGWVGIITGILGIILGVLGRKKNKAENQPTGSATAGMVMSIVGTALAGIIFAVCASAAAAGAKALDQIQKENPDFKKQLEEGLNKGIQKGLDEANK